MKNIIILIILAVVLLILVLTFRGDNEALEKQAIIDETMVENTASGLPDGSFSLNKEASTLMWSASKIGGSSHEGEVAIDSGEIIISDERLSGGEFNIDMTTISESKNSQAFLGHINSEDFFNVQEFPETRISINAMDKNEDGTFLVSGDLTIKGITNKIQFPAEITSSENELMANANIVIDRTKWDIRFGSPSFFEDLGDNAINDDIHFNLTLVLNPANTETPTEPNS